MSDSSILPSPVPSSPSGAIAPGRLFLIPTPLWEATDCTQLTPETLDITRQLRHFVVEEAKTARRILKLMEHPGPLSTLHLTLLNEHTPSSEVAQRLQPALQGQDLGLLSEAGCPAVADPGALLVRQAHQQGVPVCPLSGSSSILLALMASGLEGQRFCFHGYLPLDPAERRKQLQQLEKRSRHVRETQIFIETPYRNQGLLRAMLDTLTGTTLLSVAQNLTAPQQWIRTSTIQQWSQINPGVKERTPSIFLFLAA